MPQRRHTTAAKENKYLKTMKKNLIYILCLLFSGTMLFSSCEDMLDFDSTRVNHDFNDLTLNDSVYSVLGILKSVQTVADRHVVLGEVRGDLVVPTEKAVIDLQELCKFDYDLENPYLAVKDYYTIINNCNVFLSRVDTTLERSNKKLMLAEFVAVKSMRAWAYLQLAINYNRIPYFTEPILTHGAATDVLAQPVKSRNEIVSLLIEELTPYENPRVYPMPAWSGVEAGGGTAIPTRNLFMPIRMLLGELHLWRANAGDYRIAADYFYKSLTDTPDPATATGFRKFRDNGATVTYNEKDDNYGGNYASIFREANVTNSGTALFVSPLMESTADGYVSTLQDMFAPSVAGAAQLNSAPGYVGLSNRQVFYLKDEDKKLDEYNPSEEYVGDLRRYIVTGTQIDFGNEEYYGNVIAKHNMGDGSIVINGIPVISVSDQTTFVQFARAEQLFARFAEALYGMGRYENMYGATELSMNILKSGLNAVHKVYKNYRKELLPVIVDGDTLKTELGADSLRLQVVYDEVISYDFTVDDVNHGNKGLHSRGSGNSEFNKYYALNDSCVARYYGLVTEETDSTFVTSREVTDEERSDYLRDLIIDELALEFCFEGYRFGDLVRFAKAGEKHGDANWKDIYAKRVAGRTFANSVAVDNEAYEFDGSVYSFLLDENNWYLPLPGKLNLVEETPAE